MSSKSDEAPSPLIGDEEEEDSFKQKTYLSPLVHQLISKIGTRTSASQNEPCLLQNILIDWAALNSNALQDDIGRYCTSEIFVLNNI